MTTGEWFWNRSLDKLGERNCGGQSGGITDTSFVAQDAYTIFAESMWHFEI